VVAVVADLRESLGAELRRYLGSSSMDVYELLREYYLVKVKAISEKRRRVLVSKELSRHPLYISEKRSVIQRIFQSTESGGNLNIYLSERSRHLKYTDKALATFGVHHFHLGEAIANSGKRKGLVKGTKSLLFGRVTAEAIFFVAIFSHSVLPEFLKPELLKIIHRNWSWSISEYRLHREGAEYREVVTDEEIGKMLARDINVPIVVDGVAYFLPGGGLTAAGTSGEVEWRASRTLDEIEDLERALKAKGTEIRDYIAYKFGVCPATLSFECVILEGVIAMYEQYSEKYFTYQDGNLIGIV
jgi:hypothetical protein